MRCTLSNAAGDTDGKDLLEIKSCGESEEHLDTSMRVTLESSALTGTTCHLSCQRAIEGFASLSYHDLMSYLCVGFQMATERGPLCDEPLWGMMVTLVSDYDFILKHVKTLYRRECVCLAHQ